MTLPTAAIGAQALVPLVPAGVPTPTEPFLSLSIVSGVANGTTSVTVVAPQVTASSIIIPSLTTVGGTVGALPAVKTTTAGTGFTFAATASDTSTYSFLIIG